MAAVDTLPAGRIGGCCRHATRDELGSITAAKSQAMPLFRARLPRCRRPPSCRVVSRDREDRERDGEKERGGVSRVGTEFEGSRGRVRDFLDFGAFIWRLKSTTASAARKLMRLFRVGNGGETARLHQNTAEERIKKGDDVVCSGSAGAASLCHMLCCAVLCGAVSEQTQAFTRRQASASLTSAGLYNNINNNRGRHGRQALLIATTTK
jgi:hypothetical protein